jgi:hypothetical protein
VGLLTSPLRMVGVLGEDHSCADLSIMLLCLQLPGLLGSCHSPYHSERSLASSRHSDCSVRCWPMRWELAAGRCSCLSWRPSLAWVRCAVLVTTSNPLDGAASCVHSLSATSQLCSAVTHKASRLLHADLRLVPGLSHTIITSGAIASCGFGLAQRSPVDPNKPLMSFDIALTLVPAILFGVSFVSY